MRTATPRHTEAHKLSSFHTHYWPTSIELFAVGYAVAEASACLRRYCSEPLMLTIMPCMTPSGVVAQESHSHGEGR